MGFMQTDNGIDVDMAQAFIHRICGQGVKIDQSESCRVARIDIDVAQAIIHRTCCLE